MSRLDVRQRDCPVSAICPLVGDHSHVTCCECGALDFSNLHCLTCLTMRSVRVVSLAHAWAETGEGGR